MTLLDAEALTAINVYVPENTLRACNAILSDLTHRHKAAQVWARLAQEVLTPELPFALHQLLAAHARKHWDAVTNGPFPLWSPSPGTVQATNLAHFMADFEGGDAWTQHRTGDHAVDLPLLQQLSVQAPEVVWRGVLARLNVNFHHPPDRILHVPHTGPEDARWLPGARFNIAECALRGEESRTAVLWAAESAPGDVRRLSLGELRRQCEAVAAALRASGYRPGDAVGIDLPMTVESVAAYLGIIWAGCVAVTVADSFSAPEIATRLRIARCRAVFTQDVVERSGKAHPLFARVAEARAPPAIVVPADAAKGLAVKLRAGDVSWQAFLQRGTGIAAGAAAGAGQTHPHVAGPEDACCVLFSSGTTGEPKAIPWTHVTPIRCGTDAWVHHDVRANDVVAWPTNLGWMMGPWLVFASLLNRASMALFQGAPLGRPFGEFVAAARVTQLGVVPSIVRQWRASSCMAGLSWQRHLRCFSSTGEASSPQDCAWLMAQTRYQCPIIEYCGGTELGGGYLSGSLLQPQAPGTFSMPTLGTQLCLLLPDGRQSPHTHNAKPATGELAIVPPMLGSSQRLLNRDHHAAYFKGMPALLGNGSSVMLRRHGDEVQRLPGGYHVVLGRTDDTMNLGGIKVSSVDLERACITASEAIMEAAAVAVPPPGGGPDRLVLFLVPTKQGLGLDAARALKACQAAVRRDLNPLFKIDRVVLRPAGLPRTASGKVMRRVLRQQVQAEAAAGAAGGCGGVDSCPPRSRL